MIDLDPPRPADARPPGSAIVYVGFWIRLWASAVDSLLMMLVVVPVGWFVFGTFDGALDRTGALDFVTSTVLPAMIVLVFWIRTQGTPGKALFHARIVDARTGQPAGTAQLFVRYLGYYVSAIALGLGFLWIAVDARKQGWHDKMAGTIVIRGAAS